jgi:hypothetical protein
MFLATAALSHVPVPVLIARDRHGAWSTVRPQRSVLGSAATLVVDPLGESPSVIGTTLSAYLYSWQTNIEVEEKIAQGRLMSVSERLQPRASCTTHAPMSSLACFSRISLCILSFFRRPSRYTRPGRRTSRLRPRLLKRDDLWQVTPPLSSSR